MPENPPEYAIKRSRLRCGFSTGTAAAAAAKAALRRLLTGACGDAVAVRLPSGVYLAVPVARSGIDGKAACASVVKDGGDDPDITNGAEIRARVSILRHGPDCIRHNADMCGRQEIILAAGMGVGLVTKPGLPVAPGEPAINPVPRQELSENITLELLLTENLNLEPLFVNSSDHSVLAALADKPALHLPFYAEGGLEKTLGRAGDFSVLVEIQVPRGEELARHTLNPRLGILGGISILGTTGIVRPFSNEAYEQTIQAALSVAASSACGAVVLSTGGKSEKFARGFCRDLPPEAFIQIADFFSFAVTEARRFGFTRVIHSLFFGKAIKMAQGHPYTHARTVPLELGFLGGVARSLGYDETHCRELSSANTARHALEIIAAKGSNGILESVAQKAAAQSARIAGEGTQIRLLLFDYDGRLLADVQWMRSIPV